MSRHVSGFFLIGLICGVASCGNGFLNQMGRVLGDPSPREPRVISFVTENQIDVSWDPDRAADEYVLERRRTRWARPLPFSTGGPPLHGRKRTAAISPVIYIGSA